MLFVNVDVGELADLMGIKGALNGAANGAARDLAALTHAKITDLAGQKLKSRRKMYVTGLKYEKVDDEVWVVKLDGKVRWIDDGLPQHNMLDDLLKSPKAHRRPDGSKYVIVPFQHGPNMGPGTTTAAQQDLISTVKAEMKARGIPFGTVERNAQGQAKTGKLHSFNISNAPVKSIDGPGQGKGPIGDVKQGPTGIPLLQGVSVYQSLDKNGKAQRQIFTFRIADSRHRDQGRWEHPGTTAVNLMEEGMQWALETWEKEIAPALVDKVSMEMG